MMRMAAKSTSGSGSVNKELCDCANECKRDEFDRDDDLDCNQLCVTLIQS